MDHGLETCPKDLSDGVSVGLCPFSVTVPGGGVGCGRSQHGIRCLGWWGME